MATICTQLQPPLTPHHMHAPGADEHVRRQCKRPVPFWQLAAREAPPNEHFKKRRTDGASGASCKLISGLKRARIYNESSDSHVQPSVRRRLSEIGALQNELGAETEKCEVQRNPPQVGCEPDTDDVPSTKTIKRAASTDLEELTSKMRRLCRVEESSSVKPSSNSRNDTNRTCASVDDGTYEHDSSTRLHLDEIAKARPDANITPQSARCALLQCILRSNWWRGCQEICCSPLHAGVISNGDPRENLQVVEYCSPYAQGLHNLIWPTTSRKCKSSFCFEQRIAEDGILEFVKHAGWADVLRCFRRCRLDAQVEAASTAPSSTTLIEEIFDKDEMDNSDTAQDMHG